MDEHLAYRRNDEVYFDPPRTKETYFALHSLDRERSDAVGVFPSAELLGRFLAKRVYTEAKDHISLFSNGIWLIRFENAEDFTRLSKNPPRPNTTGSILYHDYPKMAMNEHAISISGAVSDTDDFFKIAEGYVSQFRSLMEMRRRVHPCARASFGERFCDAVKSVLSQPR